MRANPEVPFLAGSSREARPPLIAIVFGRIRRLGSRGIRIANPHIRRRALDLAGKKKTIVLGRVICRARGRKIAGRIEVPTAAIGVVGALVHKRLATRADDLVRRRVGKILATGVIATR